MSFLQPDRLYLLLVVLAIAGAYLFLQSRRKVYAARLASAEMLSSIVPHHPGWRRHIAALVVLASLTTLVLGFAQPTAETKVPRERATVVVAIDVSLSMEADDVDPTRLQAAQQAARDFVSELPPTLNVGIVGFAGQASILVPPTQNRTVALAAIDGLELAESTAIGEAIFTSLDALKQVPSDGTDEPAPARIVLLSDGETTMGRPDEQAVAAANAAGVPVSTIAFGTKDGVISYDDPTTEAVEEQIIPVPVGDENLRAIADATSGAFFSAKSLAELDVVYDDIGSAIGYETVEREITDRFVGGALALLLLASGLSLWWFQRLL